LQGFDTDANFIVYYSTADSAQPVVTGGEFGEGKYLHFGALLDPVTDGGYARFPYLIDLLNRHFSLKPMVHRRAIEVYFEPGDREDISIEDLIKMWRSNGVRAVYVSGWHFYADYQYDYERLIRLAHQNAMVVYLCWNCRMSMMCSGRVSQSGERRMHSAWMQSSVGANSWR
jgi:hypothetical protein